MSRCDPRPQLLGHLPTIWLPSISSPQESRKAWPSQQRQRMPAYSRIGCRRQNSSIFDAQLFDCLTDMAWKLFGRAHIVRDIPRLREPLAPDAFSEEDDAPIYCNRHQIVLSQLHYNERITSSHVLIKCERSSEFLSREHYTLHDKQS